MPTIKYIYKEFLGSNFKGLRLRKPLFYSWNFGLRFGLQVGECGTEKYFDEVINRATKIFQLAFDEYDDIFLIFIDFKYRRRKIRSSNFVFRQIANLTKNEISYSEEFQLYRANDKFDKRNIAIIKITTNRLNYKSILSAISNSDFGNRQPRLDGKSFFTEKEIYFININKKLILNMYDDRGLDIVSADLETLRPIYEKYKSWILNYDKEQIEKQFEK